MMISIALVILSALIFLFLVRVASARTPAMQVLENPGAHLRAVDIDAFRNLIDPEEEEFLRAFLEPSEFRRIQRQRLRAAVEYIHCAAHNAALLLHMAEAARRSPDAEVAARAEQLIDNAIRLRLYALQAIPRLYIAMVLPLGNSSTIRVADRYEQMTRQVVMLGLQYPTGTIASTL
jgi:hypothetical protein